MNPIDSKVARYLSFPETVNDCFSNKRETGFDSNSLTAVVKKSLSILKDNNSLDSDVANNTLRVLKDDNSWESNLTKKTLNVFNDGNFPEL